MHRIGGSADARDVGGSALDGTGIRRRCGDVPPEVPGQAHTAKGSSTTSV